jgi:hypothetical protein
MNRRDPLNPGPSGFQRVGERSVLDTYEHCNGQPAHGALGRILLPITPL